LLYNLSWSNAKHWGSSSTRGEELVKDGSGKYGLGKYNLGEDAWLRQRWLIFAYALAQLSQHLRTESCICFSVKIF
jgi:hypothetical protein